MRERVDLKSPVRENRLPGSVRGAPGNRRPYRDNLADQPRPGAYFNGSGAMVRGKSDRARGAGAGLRVVAASEALRW